MDTLKKYAARAGLTWLVMSAPIQAADPDDIARLAMLVESSQPRFFHRGIELRTRHFSDVGIIASIVRGNGKKVVILYDSKGDPPFYYGDGLDSEPGKVDFIYSAPTNLFEALSVPSSEPTVDEQYKFDQMMEKLNPVIAAEMGENANWVEINEQR